MSKANADIKYDPELPFVVAIENYPKDYVILGRCSTRQYAEDLVRNGTILRKIIDTTPKPKIPVDAEFIFVEDGDQSVFARREGIMYEHGEMHWLVMGTYLSESDLIEDFIGDAEVTVLVRKEET